MRKAVPRGRSLRTSIRPACRVTMPYVIDSPRPVPVPFFVVKKGLKIFLKSSSFMHFLEDGLKKAISKGEVELEGDLEFLVKKENQYLK